MTPTGTGVTFANLSRWTPGRRLIDPSVAIRCYMQAIQNTSQSAAFTQLRAWSSLTRTPKSSHALAKLFRAHLPLLPCRRAMQLLDPGRILLPRAMLQPAVRRYGRQSRPSGHSSEHIQGSQGTARPKLLAVMVRPRLCNVAKLQKQDVAPAGKNPGPV